MIVFLIVFGFVQKNQAQNSVFKADDINIDYEKFVLPNGLTLLVHEDHKAPIVAVNVWYHVGSKNEKEGKSGFAHLFEHLMFNGSENYDDDYFQVIERIGEPMLTEQQIQIEQTIFKMFRFQLWTRCYF